MMINTSLDSFSLPMNPVYITVPVPSIYGHLRDALLVSCHLVTNKGKDFGETANKNSILIDETKLDFAENLAVTQKLP